ncbi:MAG: CFI-box-CTERM domain-containing protein [Candidatus Thorarchaeota archaeon]
MSYKDGMHPCVLLAGKTGAGKTSLAQAILGVEAVPDSRIGHGRPTTEAFTFYESTSFLSVWDWRGYEPGEPLNKYREEMFKHAKQHKGDDESKRPDLVWYCIDGSGARICKADIKLIHEFPLLSIPIVTKCETVTRSTRRLIAQSLNDSGIDTRNLVYVSSDDRKGLRKLIWRTRGMLKHARIRAEKAYKEDCYIATSVFGSRYHPSVMKLRRHRDTTLRGHALGRVLIRAYRTIGPFLACHLSGNQFMKAVLNEYVRILGRRD